MQSEDTMRTTRRAGPLMRLSQQMRLDVAGYLFCLPWILSLIIFTAYPTIASFYFSFTKYSILKAPRWIGIGNYRTLFFNDPLFYKSIYNTVYFTFLLVPLGLISSLLLAVLLNQRLGGVGFYRTLYYVPSLVPPVAGTLIWMLILDSRQGLLNVALRAVGIDAPGWFSSPTWAKPGLIMMSLWGGGSSTLIFLAGLKEVPQELLEAAEIDGAGRLRRFLSVVLPMISPVLLFNLVMGIINSFQVFTTAFIAGGGSGGGLSGGGPSGAAGGPLDSMLMYMLYLYRHAFHYFDMGYASAMAVLLFVFILIMTLLIFRSSERWVYYAGRR